MELIDDRTMEKGLRFSTVPIIFVVGATISRLYFGLVPVVVEANLIFKMKSADVFAACPLYVPVRH
jgi:hypothetical protein